jgi:mutator protein MutT
MGTPDERVDEVDAHDRVIGTMTRADMRARRARHRAVFVAVTNERGQILVHRRAPDKDLWPDRWDLAAGGVVGAGEDYESAARRELAEELGIVTNELRQVSTGSYEDPDVALVAAVYVVSWDGPVHFADGEVTEAVWVDLDELDDMIARRPFVPDSVALVRGHLGSS